MPNNEDQINDAALLIPGTDIKIGFWDLDIHSKKATIGVIEGGILTGWKEQKIDPGSNISPLDNYRFIVTRLSESYIRINIMKSSDIFKIESGDTNVLGYARADVNDSIPHYLVFSDSPLRLKPNASKQIENLNYYLFWDKSGRLRLLQFVSSVIQEESGQRISRADTIDCQDIFKDFIPEHENKFIVKDGLTTVGWKMGSEEKGLRFDADGDGRLDGKYDYTVINDFLITSVNENQILVKPIMAINIKDRLHFNVRGQLYQVLGRSRNSITLAPADSRLLVDANKINEYFFDSAFLIPETDIKIGLMNYNSEDKTCIFGIIEGGVLTNVLERELQVGEDIDILYRFQIIPTKIEEDHFKFKILAKDRAEELGEATQLFSGSSKMLEPPSPTKENFKIGRCPLNFGLCNQEDEIEKGYADNRIFIDIPYKADYGEFEEVILRIVRNAGLEPVLAKDKSTSDIMLCKVCRLIHTCKYGIADISYSTLNVPFELGIMFGLSKKCAILRKRDSAQPADIQGKESRLYESTDELEKELNTWINHNVPERDRINNQKRQ